MKELTDFEMQEIKGGDDHGISVITGNGTGEHISGAAKSSGGYKNYVINVVGIDHDGDGEAEMSEHALWVLAC